MRTIKKTVRLNREEAVILKEMAKSMGVTESDVIRRCLMEVFNLTARLKLENVDFGKMENLARN